MTKLNKNKEFIDEYSPIIPKPLSGKIIVLGLLFLFLMATSYKLTNSSLWVDEGVEYLISAMPFNKMISAINGTFQPPLYNFIMHFLLKLSVNEFWFRFTSVLFGLGGCIGLYCAVNEWANWKAASVAIFFYTFLRNSIYYNQECAEYSLLIGVLFWAIYFFVCLLRKFSLQKAIGFAAFCILSIYSQYGAIFPLFGLSLSILLYYFLDKQWTNLKKIIFIMGSAVIAFGTPLYLCFTHFQRESQNIPAAKLYTNLFEEIQIFIKGLRVDFSFFFTTFYQNNLLIILVDLFYVFAILIIIWSLSQRRNRQLKYIGLSAILTYLSYYIAIRLGIYAYGNNGGRYVLAILPVVLFCLCVTFYSLFQMLQTILKKKSAFFAYGSVVLFLAVLCLHNYNNWKTIQINRYKEDVRSAFNLWLSETDATEELYLYYAAVPVFSFYAEEFGLDYGKEAVGEWGFFGTNINPQITQYKNFHYGENIRGCDAEYVKDSLQKSFSDNMPDNFWFMLSHIHPDNQVYMDILSEMGYGYQVYRWSDARLLRLYNNNYLDNNYFSVVDNDNLATLISGIDQMEQSMGEGNDIIFQTTGDDPKIFFEIADSVNYDMLKSHKALIEFSSEYDGSLQLFYLDGDNKEFISENVISSQYVSGYNRVLVELPEYAQPYKLRLDIDNSNIPDGGENKVIISRFAIFEEK